LNRIEEQVRICDSIVSDLLEYTRSSRLNAFRSDLLIWIPPLLDQIFEGESIIVKRNFAKGLPEIDHDRIRLQQAVINVLDNALQAVKAKADLCTREKKIYGPEIEVVIEADPGTIVMKISDNGVGMDGNALEQAFEPLFTTRARGTGLGLANARKIVQEHGGEIALTSRLNLGTEVVIQLPVRSQQGQGGEA
jgi:signal transduction histidine kinase